MNAKTTALPLLAAALLGAGCVDMMVGNGPSGMSFTPPPTQPEVWPEPLPMESIVGKWVSEATSDYFLSWTTGWRRWWPLYGFKQLSQIVRPGLLFVCLPSREDQASGGKKIVAMR